MNDTNLKGQIEVLLFLRTQPQSIARLAEELASDPPTVKSMLMDLVREYELREGGLQITHKGQGYVMEPREEYLSLIDKIAPVDLKTGALRTLALIALNEPVKQREIVNLRGSGAYEHIKELVEAGWILKKPLGLSFELMTTEIFKKHFRLSEQGADLKEKLKELIKNSETDAGSGIDSDLLVTEELV
ncbi:MAG: SMC-Scp complex subunit ScpB [Candidatus Caenarcaniphilales bacterium]|nr:SMC-Scp complex subunit ScpB [Candidatus Caenarcaniphilales bacterium]